VTAAPDRSAGHADARRRFGLFSLLFGLSLVLHQLWWDGFEVWSPHFVVIVAACWAALRPTSVARFLAMVAAEVAAVALEMPGAGSHTVLVGVVGACVIAYAAWTAAARGGLPDAGALFERIAPFLRVSVLVVYAAAAVAKMNSGFFDADISCAAAMASTVAWFDPSLLDGAWLIGPAMWGTVLLEVLLPVLLAVPRTRVAGLVVGTGFHLVLALAGNVPFSSLMLALYVAFLPTGALARAGRVFAVRPRAPGWAAPAAFVAMVGSWLAGALAASAEPSLVAALIDHGTRLVVVAVVLGAAWAAVAVWRSGGAPTAHAPRSLRLGHPVFAAGIALLVANSLTPYLGLKTESSFTMFSNLQTEDGYWNHAFIPEAVRVFRYQDQLVHVVESSDPRLERRSSDGTRLVRFELERYLRLNPGVRVTYAVTDASGRARRPTVVGATAGDGGALSATRLVDKVAKFRDVRAPGRRGC
jgi:hypothetical protein